MCYLGLFSINSFLAAGFDLLKNSRVPAVIFAFVIIACSCQRAFAISEYGLRCEDNKKCIICTNDIKCIKCMHRCWNIYGYADTDIKGTKEHTAEAICQLMRAKWCSAQCWDPDETKDPDYVSTKPSCDEKRFYAPKGGIKFPKNRPAF